MDPNELEGICRAIQARDRHAENLKKASEETNPTLWWHHLIWSHNRQNKTANEKAKKLASLQSKIDENEKKITPDGVQHLARMIATELWKDAAKSVLSNKNPFGQAAVGQFPGILQLALKRREKFILVVGQRQLSFTLADLPDINKHLTDGFIETNARDIICTYDAIAASTEFVHKRYRNNDGDPEMIVQHLKSGLRAKFTINKPGFGTVFSKPYDIESIDPEKPGNLIHWEQYTGLGIGGLIYTEAHCLAPDVRWVKGLTSEYSTPLRTKLHADNPHIWDSQCAWCEKNLVRLGIRSWSHADQDFFTNHP